MYGWVWLGLAPVRFLSSSPLTKSSLMETDEGQKGFLIWWTGSVGGGGVGGTVGLTIHASVTCLHNLISGQMEHACTTCSPNMALISKPNKKHSKWRLSKRKQSSASGAWPQWCTCTCALPLAHCLGKCRGLYPEWGGGKTLHHTDKGTKWALPFWMHNVFAFHAPL